MKIEIPDAIVQHAEATADELRAALAIQLYADNRIDYADACRLAGVSKAVFNGELLSRALSIQQYPAGSAAKQRSTG